MGVSVIRGPGSNGHPASFPFMRKRGFASASRIDKFSTSWQSSYSMVLAPCGGGICFPEYVLVHVIHL